jgi:carbamoyltransferase
MQSIMNLKVKFRESFRPFAPVVRRERVQDYFELDTDSPYMLLVAPVRSALRVEHTARPATAPASGTDAHPPPASTASPRALAPNLIERVNQPRSTIPAVTHIDYSARIQTVDRAESPLLYALLEEWERASGCGVLVNTSFNVRGEPIVCTPDDAYRCFVNTEMDYLVMGNFILERAAQPQREVRRTFEPVPD